MRLYEREKLHGQCVCFLKRSLLRQLHRFDTSVSSSNYRRYQSLDLFQ